MSVKKIAVLISGGGTNLQALIDACESGQIPGSIDLVISSSKKAYGLERARMHDIDTMTYEGGGLKAFHEKVARELKERQVDFIVLAGYLKVLPASFTDAFRGQIINIHPSLIPKYCGVGFYGERVHQAVFEAGEKESGATVHFVDSGCDTGPILLQEKVSLEEGDSPDVIAKKVLKVEHKILPKALELLCSDQVFLNEKGEVQWKKER